MLFASNFMVQCTKVSSHVHHITIFASLIAPLTHNAPFHAHRYTHHCTLCHSHTHFAIINPINPNTNSKSHTKPDKSHSLFPATCNIYKLYIFLKLILFILSTFGPLQLFGKYGLVPHCLAIRVTVHAGRTFTQKLVVRKKYFFMFS